MSAPPSIRQITREALGAAAPDWADELLKPLNTVLGQMQDLFTNNLTPRENLAQQWVEVTVTGGAAVPAFGVNLKGRTAKGVSVERVTALGSGSTPGTAPTAAVTLIWAPTSVEGKPGVAISSVFGLVAAARYTLTLLVKAE